MIIKYRGGPLNGQSFTGSSRQYRYRDGSGNPLVAQTDQGVVAAFGRLAKQTGGDLYVYDTRQCRYDHLSFLRQQRRTLTIERLLVERYNRPQDAARIDAEISRLERETEGAL